MTDRYGAAMPILLGVLASLAIGVSDTCGRASAKRADSVSHVSVQMIVGTIVAVPVALVLGSQLIGVDVIKGALSGVCVAVGLSIVYKAMSEASSAVVAPTAAVLAAVLPLAWDLIGGTRLAPLAAVGCGVALVSLGLTTFDPDLGDRIWAGLLWALVGGAFFGLSIVFVGDTSADSGAWPAAIQRFTGFLAMVVLARRRNVPLGLPRGVRRFGVLGGIAGAVGMVAWAIGAQQGDLGTVSIAAATYPAVVAVLTLFDGDRLRWWQALGIAGAIIGTILIAVASQTG